MNNIQFFTLIHLGPLWIYFGMMMKYFDFFIGLLGGTICTVVILGVFKRLESNTTVLELDEE